MIRRHAKSDREMHFGPALRVVSGNYIAAKRRGIHEGMDFGYTGEVGEGCWCAGWLNGWRLACC
jgi:amino-acid N-acetyltransferase